MQQGPYLITYRRSRHTRGSFGAWVVAAAIIALLGVGGFVLQARSGAAASLPNKSENPISDSPQSAAPESAASETDTQTPQKVAAAVQQASDDPSPPPAKPSDSPDAVTDAALDYPDTPSVKPKSIASMNPTHKYIAITLDDGYGLTPEMIALLRKYDARCTVFVVGQWAAANPKMLRKLDKAGFEIANHTWDHKNLTTLSDAEVRNQLRRTQKAISSVTGNQAPYMRPPGGATNDRVKQLSGELGYKVVMWNRSFADTSPKASPQRSYRSVMLRSGGVRPGDIIVGHLGSDDTYEALKRILPELKARGYEFVTVSELIADSKKRK